MGPFPALQITFFYHFLYVTPDRPPMVAVMLMVNTRKTCIFEGGPHISRFTVYLIHFFHKQLLWQSVIRIYGNDWVWVYVVSESLGIGRVAMFAAFPSTIMEAAFGRLHNNRAGASAASPIVWTPWWMERRQT